MIAREIKFRAWNGKRMLNRTIWDRNWYTKDNRCVCGAVPEDRTKLVLMQFTGLKDKNGVDIYEGDVLEFGDKWKETLLIEWGKSCGCCGTFHAWPTHDHYGMDGKIIGNIYENPDLLEKTTDLS